MKNKMSKAKGAARNSRASNGSESASLADMRECIECLYGVVIDVMPQIGRIVLQDYEGLNRGTILARSILRQPTPNVESSDAMGGRE